MIGLPPGWIKAPIGDLCNLQNGRSFKPTEWSDAGTPIIRIQNLNNSDAKFNYFAGEIDPRHAINNGDLLFAWSGTPGTSFGAHIWQRGNAVLNQHIFKVIFDTTRIDVGFFRLALNQTIDELSAKAHGGVGLRHITKSKFEETEIFFPPLEEQKRIAHKVTALSDSIKIIREELLASSRLTTNYKLSVLSAAFTGNLTRHWREKYKLPRGEALRIDELITDLRYGTSQKCHMEEVGTAVLRIPNIKHGHINLEELKYTTLHKSALDKLQLESGDILVVRSNGSTDLVGRSAVVSEEAAGMAYAGYLIRLRPSQRKILPRYFSYMLHSPETRTSIENTIRSTSGVNNINTAEISALLIPTPTLAEQQEIVRLIDSHFIKADSIIKQQTSAINLICNYERELLVKVFQGKLVSQHFNDGSASENFSAIKSQLSEQLTNQNNIIPHAKNPHKLSSASRKIHMKLTNKTTEQNFLSRILKEIGGSAQAKDLWQKSKMSIDDFYKQLRLEVIAGLISEGSSKEELVTTNAS